MGRAERQGRARGTLSKGEAPLKAVRISLSIDPGFQLDRIRALARRAGRADRLLAQLSRQCCSICVVEYELQMRSRLSDRERRAVGAERNGAAWRFVGVRRAFFDIPNSSYGDRRGQIATKLQYPQHQQDRHADEEKVQQDCFHSPLTFCR